MGAGDPRGESRGRPGWLLPSDSPAPISLLPPPEEGAELYELGLRGRIWIVGRDRSLPGDQCCDPVEAEHLLEAAAGIALRSPVSEEQLEARHWAPGCRVFEEQLDRVVDARAQVALERFV